jgi:hypothetical protein
VYGKGTSRRCGALGDHTLFWMYIASAANFSSRALLIGAGGGTHCPLIRKITLIRAWGGGLYPP